MGEVKHDMPRQSFWRKSGCQSKGGAGHQAFGVTAGHADSNHCSLGVIVGDWGIGHKVVPIGAGIGNACVISW